MEKLKCQKCGGTLNLTVPYDGCDFESEAGEGSGFDYVIELDCDECGAVYPIGRLKNEFEFSRMKDKNSRPYGW